MSSREQFEAWWEINYHNGNPPRFGWAAWRDGDGYQIDDDEPELDGMWQAWQAATSAMEAKCAALAVENAGLKQAESNLVRNIINDLGDIEFQYARVQTPATDAFRAEVRAIAISQEQSS